MVGVNVKIDNKGFAISSIMYLILVMSIILITVTLAILGNRKIILDKQKSEVLENIYDEKVYKDSSGALPPVLGNLTPVKYDNEK